MGQNIAGAPNPDSWTSEPIINCIRKFLDVTFEIGIKKSPLFKDLTGFRRGRIKEEEGGLQKVCLSPFSPPADLGYVT